MSGRDLMLVDLLVAGFVVVRWKIAGVELGIAGRIDIVDIVVGPVQGSEVVCMLLEAGRYYNVRMARCIAFPVFVAGLAVARPEDEVVRILDQTRSVRFQCVDFASFAVAVAVAEAAFFVAGLAAEG
jgi:hypothetical protein